MDIEGGEIPWIKSLSNEQINLNKLLWNFIILFLKMK